VRCLLVDDNGAFIETARLLLAREGVVVAGAASSIAEALRQASALRPDVVLVDIALGDENGFDLARRLAGSGTGGDAAVIMISTRAGADYALPIPTARPPGFWPRTSCRPRRSSGSSAGSDREHEAKPAA